MTRATQQLSELGVSVWLDDLSRTALNSGELERRIAELDVVGVTTNPAIFATAITSDVAYREGVLAAQRQGLSSSETVFRLASEDVAQACDLMEPVYRKSGGRDGRVSIEVDPKHADDREATVEQAVTLWNSINKPNLMIKVPATEAGIVATADLLGRGISVNVTLIFGVTQYRRVLNAYLIGLERARAAGLDLAAIHSVASFFVSRFDTLVDPQLPADSELRGQGGIANANIAYTVWQQTFESARAETLLALGANRQRLLWASTGVKNDAYPQDLYITELIGRETVNTLPPATLEFFAETEQPLSVKLGENTVTSKHVLDEIARSGIDYAETVAQLLDEGLEKFDTAWLQLLQSVESELARQE